VKKKHVLVELKKGEEKKLEEEPRRSGVLFSLEKGQKNPRG